MRTDRDALETWRYTDLRLYARDRADLLTRLKWWVVGIPEREALEDRLASNEFTRDEEAEIRRLIAEELGEEDVEEDPVEEAERLVAEHRN
jgi:hypothetical protein